MRGGVVRACERLCEVTCNLPVARERAVEQNAAIEGAIVLPEQETAEWQERMANIAWIVAGITDAATAVAAPKAAVAGERRGAEAAAREAAAPLERRAIEEAIAKREAEVRALEEALA